MTTLPAHNAVIVFTTLPPGSYASPSTPYRVDRPNPRSDFRLVNVKTGGSTYERPWQLARAAWHPAT